MRMYDEIQGYRKEYVYEQYTRIVEDFKDYQKITKTKMLDAIYGVYSNSQNIIDICTKRELKYLEKILDSNSFVDYLDSKYDFERESLRNKFLIHWGFGEELLIPDEVVEEVKTALKHVRWNEKKKTDDLNEIVVSYCKMQGSALLHVVASFASGITGIEENHIWNHMLENKLFNYYVMIVLKDYETLGKNIPIAIHQDYYEISDELEKQRKVQGIAGAGKIDIRDYRTLFYHDFNVRNPKIKKFLNRLENMPIYSFPILSSIREFAMLNIDRTPLKKSIKNIPILQNEDLTELFHAMDEAMDEMPSGALNGFTPNEVKKLKEKENEIKIKKKKGYTPQKDACLSSKDASLFYKIYFGLLDFTNRKYKIKPNVKIYKQEGIDPNEIKDIVEKFWNQKEAIVLEFCISNPYRFSKKELQITGEFKKGIRGLFIIASFEDEYTAFMIQDKTYMIKGINSNIDEVVSYDQLPYPVMTSIIPFQDCLIYDGMLLGMGIRMDSGFYDVVVKEYETSTKYYHL